MHGFSYNLDVAKLTLRVTKWLGTTPATAVCTACGTEFKVLHFGAYQAFEEFLLAGQLGERRGPHATSSRCGGRSRSCVGHSNSQPQPRSSGSFWKWQLGLCRRERAVQRSRAKRRASPHENFVHLYKGVIPPPKTAKLKQFADLLELLNEIRGCSHVLQIVANWNRNHKGYPPTSRHRSRAAIHRDSGNTWPTKRSASSLWTKTLQKAEPSRLKTRTSARNSKPSIQRRLHSTIAARFHWTKSSPAFSKTSLVSSFEAGQAWPTAMSRLTADYRRRRGCRVHTGVADFGWMVGQRR